jgi:hypothetical protein
VLGLNAQIKSLLLHFFAIWIILPMCWKRVHSVIILLAAQLFKRHQFTGTGWFGVWFFRAERAGKTTTLRLVLGLLKKQQGEIRLFGKPFNRHRLECLRKIGAMIESPSLYGHLPRLKTCRCCKRFTNANL